MGCSARVQCAGLKVIVMLATFSKRPTMTTALQCWLESPLPETFPLSEVISEFRRVGKHFVSPELLQLLAKARKLLPQGADALRRFLDTTLDKYDGRYDNPTYLALHDLPLPSTAGRCPLHTGEAEAQRDRLVVLLVADLLRFEIDALDGTHDLLPEMRPDARIVAKRCTLGLLVLRPAMERLGLDTITHSEGAIEVARDLCRRVASTHSEQDKRMLAVTLLTVSTVHDENLFVRVLQSYETSFALAVVQLNAAIVALMAKDATRAAGALQTAERAMREISPMFSLVATMRPEAFVAFREYTHGASAIQSRNYKLIESLCRLPAAERIAGPGYEAVPEVRERIVAGQPTIEDARRAANLTADQAAELSHAMAAFEAAITDWRRMHHNLAMRMLGVRRGTGYTEGVPYLAEARSQPVFSCPFAGGR
jgi:tryptophan 2,3-dioxygenase